MISLIYACDEANGIGRENKLPWYLKSELQHFKKHTENNVVIMGRKTFESFGSKPLKNRINIVLSKDQNYGIEYYKNAKNPNFKNLIFSNATNSIKEFLQVIKSKFNDKKIFIIGGAELYKQTIEFVDEVIQTVVCDEFECDTFFEFNQDKFEITKSEKCLDSTTGIEYTINRLIRKTNDND